MTTTSKSRTPSEATIKTRAFRAFVDAEAKFRKAKGAREDAHDREDAALAALKAAREECARLGVPIAEEPK